MVSAVSCGAKRLVHAWLCSGRPPRRHIVFFMLAAPCAGAADLDTAGASYMELPAQPDSQLQAGALDTVDLAQSECASIPGEEPRTAVPGASTAAAPPSRLTASLDVATTSSSDATSFSLSVPGAAAGLLQYTRMDIPQHDSDSANAQHDEDPLTGYFLGSYGSNGPELLHLQRGVWQGRPAVVAHKVTGGEHVSAGFVS